MNKSAPSCFTCYINDVSAVETAPTRCVPSQSVEEQTQDTELSVRINRLPIRAGLVRICLRCVLLGWDFNTDLYTFSVLILTRKTSRERRLLGGGGGGRLMTN